VPRRVAPRWSGAAGDGSPNSFFSPYKDDAFNKLPAGVLQKLLEPANKAELVDILTYHVVAGVAAKSTDLSNGEEIKTVEGKNVTVNINGGKVFINNAQVVLANVMASNGVVHEIDQVLLPPTLAEKYGADKNIVEIAVATPDLSTLVAALKAGGLVSTLEGPGPFTVFAPTNEAFNKIPPAVLHHLLQPANKAELVDILTYHVVAGVAAKSTDLSNGMEIKTVEGKNVTVTITHSNVFIDHAKVLTANIEASNGIIHTIDEVLIPPKFMAKVEAKAAEGTIVDIAVATPELSTLVTALKAGDRVSTLASPGNFTVFAPTNEAFAKLPAGVLNHLLEPANKAELVKILTYHVVSGVRAKSTDLSNGEKIKTVEGSDVVAYVNHRGVFINQAPVLKADIEASNGIVHIIGDVLVPRSEIMRLAFLAFAN
jgi:transforming growth factor-beta-induced protein